MATVNTLIDGAKAVLSDVILLLKDDTVKELAHIALDIFREETGYFRDVEIKTLTDGEIKTAVPDGFRSVLQACDAGGREIPWKVDGSFLVIDTDEPESVDMPVKIFYFFGFDHYQGKEGDALPPDLPLSLIRSLLEAMIRKKNAPLVRSAAEAAGIPSESSGDSEGVKQEINDIVQRMKDAAAFLPPIYQTVAFRG